MPSYLQCRTIVLRLNIEECAKWLHYIMHETLEETFKSKTFNFLSLFMFADMTGRIIEERTKRLNIVENNISHFQRASYPLFYCRTTCDQRRRVAQNKSIDYTVFSDSASIVACSPSGLSTPTELLINSSLGTRLATTELSY